VHTGERRARDQIPSEGQPSHQDRLETEISDEAGGEGDRFRIVAGDRDPGWAAPFRLLLQPGVSDRIEGTHDLLGAEPLGGREPGTAFSVHAPDELLAVARRDRVRDIDDQPLPCERRSMIAADLLHGGIGHHDQDHIRERDGLFDRARARVRPRRGHQVAELLGMAGREHDWMPASGEQLAERATLTAGADGRDLECGDIPGLRVRRSTAGEHRERDGPAARCHNTPAREPRSCKTGHENSSDVPMPDDGTWRRLATPARASRGSWVKTQSTNLVGLTRTRPLPPWNSRPRWNW